MINLHLDKRVYHYSFTYNDNEFYSEVICDYYSKTTEHRTYYKSNNNLCCGALAPTLSIDHRYFIESSLDSHFGSYLTLF